MFITRVRRFAGAAGTLAFALIALSCSDGNISSPLVKGSAAATRSQAPGAVTWLAPLGTGAANPATFDAAAVQRVEICAWSGTACIGALTAQLSTTPSAGVGTLTANVTLGKYQAAWNLMSPTLLTRKTYRIRALKGTTEVGAISVDVIRGRWGLTRADGSLAPLVAATDLAIEFHVALVPPPLVRINEIESSGGVPGDWVELYNADATTVDLSGFVFKDGDDTHSYTIPTGTTMAPGTYFVLEEAAFGFGLGTPDAARLFTPSGVIVDSYSWSPHATTSYGRCPNGSGVFTTTTTVTKGAGNDCRVPNTVMIDEVESSGGSPGDWIELVNTGVSPVDISGYVLEDDNDTHTFTIPAGTVIAAGAYLAFDVETSFGLGAPDAARLFNASGTLLDAYSWSSHAATTYGRCPTGTGTFITTTSVTKGAANDCSSPSDIKINEVESNGGTPGDWIELVNNGGSPINVGGYFLKDNDNSHTFTIASGTVIPAGGHMAFDVEVNFGLGAADDARLFTPGGALLDSYTWTAHATTTYGRCPDGTGTFTTTLASTKGAVNACSLVAQSWPGTDNVTTVDGLNVFSSNMSGLIFELAINGSPDALWAARNGPGTLYRLIFDGSIWTPDPLNGWSAGKALRYMDGTGDPDAEDVTFTTGSSAGMYVSTERNNSNNGVSRPAILRFDPTVAGTALTATNDWNLTADLPVVAANSGLEAITWIPDSALVAGGFFDPAANHLYNPADYPNHAGGLFFVGLEANGMVYVYALNHLTNGYTRITSFTTGFPSGVMALQYDRELGQLWATCDDTCGGLADIFVIDNGASSSTKGQMKMTYIFARPSSMPNINNEGFAFGPQSQCSAGFKPAFWSDDSSTGGHAIRMASIPCVIFP